MFADCSRLALIDKRGGPISIVHPRYQRVSCPNLRPDLQVGGMQDPVNDIIGRLINSQRQTQLTRRAHL